jgi:hypothetical protein
MQLDRLEPILREHYANVGSHFSDRMTEQMPIDVETTQDERDLIESSLLFLFVKRAKEQSRHISETTQSAADTAWLSAKEEADQIIREGGLPLSRHEQAATAGALFDRTQRGRRGAIACLETQASAETAKQVEVEGLAGFSAVIVGIVGGSATATVMPKEWVSQGDSVVRDNHLDADSQRVDAGAPYVVGGERLMFPGDTSLGASVSNVINCRCASIFDPEPIIADRRAEGK